MKILFVLDLIKILFWIAIIFKYLKNITKHLLLGKRKNVFFVDSCDEELC